MGKYGYLLNSQAADLFRILGIEGFSQNEFGFVLEDGEDTGKRAFEPLRLVYKADQNYYFDMSLGYTQEEARRRRYHFNSGEHCIKFSPGADTPNDYQDQLSWEDVQFEFRHWAMRLKQELETEDVWAELANSKPLPNTPTAKPTAFSADEQKIISRNIDSLIASVNELRVLTKAQGEEFRSGMSDLKAATERVGWKDWRLLLYGKILDFGLTQMLSGDVVRTIFEAATFTISNIIAAIGQRHTSLLRP